jgi:hypothetical protein
MGFIPHPPLYLSQVRPVDMALLLTIGAVWEVVCRFYLLSVKQKSSSLVAKEDKLEYLQHDVELKRKMGPSKFVETSKLERQILALEQELESLTVANAKNLLQMEKYLLRYGNMLLAFFLFIAYYGVPLMTIQPLEDRFVVLTRQQESEAAAADPTGSFLKALLFPVSYVGIGSKISKWGIDPDVATSSIGALVVMWSAQVTTGKLMDAVDAYIL